MGTVMCPLKTAVGQPAQAQPPGGLVGSRGLKSHLAVGSGLAAGRQCCRGEHCPPPATPRAKKKVVSAHWPLWLARDRFRTMINVLGDALAAGIMAHICRKDFTQDTGTEVRVEPPPTHPPTTPPSYPPHPH